MSFRTRGQRFFEWLRDIAPALLFYGVVLGIVAKFNADANDERHKRLDRIIELLEEARGDD